MSHFRAIFVNVMLVVLGEARFIAAVGTRKRQHLCCILYYCLNNCNVCPPKRWKPTSASQKVNLDLQCCISILSNSILKGIQFNLPIEVHSPRVGVSRVIWHIFIHNYALVSSISTPSLLYNQIRPQLRSLLSLEYFIVLVLA